MAIKIKGVIGSDIRGAEFADRISKLSGDIEFEIDSPGGSVFHGISIFNAIKNYDRGKCRMHVVGDCSSMAAYIMLAGDSLDFEPNSIVVLHNPWSIAIGDYRDMQKEGAILEKLAALYAKEFVKKGIFEEKEIRSIMDEETWFIGAEQLKKLGNVLENDSQSGSNDEDDDEIKIAGCRERMKEAIAAVRKMNDENLDKIAALLPKEQISAHKTEQTAHQGINTTKEEKGETKMVANLDELKAQKPSIYAEAKADGAKEEKARVDALLTCYEANPQAVIEAIQSGTKVSDDGFQAKILMAKVGKQEIKGMSDGNPPQVQPKAETHAPENEGEQTEEEKKKEQEAKDEKTFNEILAKMGISEK